MNITKYDKFCIYKVRGDGNCFINSILEVFCSEYRNLDDRYKKAYSDKVRLDIAYYLLSKSNKSKEEINSRLAIINTSVMCKYFKNDDNYAFDYLNGLKELYLKNELNKEEIYYLISENLTDINEIHFSVDNIKYLYENDFRLHEIFLYKNTIEAINFSLESFFVNDYDNDLVFYEICESLISGVDQIEMVITNLIDFNSWINEITTNVICSLLNLNLIIFPKGLGYTDIQYYNCNKINSKYIMMINYNNTHWDIIGVKQNKKFIFCLENQPNKELLDHIFNKIK